MTYGDFASYTLTNKKKKGLKVTNISDFPFDVCVNTISAVFNEHQP